MDRQLTGLHSRQDVASNLQTELNAAVDRLCRFEGDILRADTLLKAVRTRLLSNDEWCELSLLVRRSRRELPKLEPELTATLHRLERCGAVHPAHARLMEESLHGLDRTHAYLHSNDPPWADVVRRVVTRLPTGLHSAVAVESRVVQGAALGPFGVSNRAADAPSGESRGVRYGHPSGLALTTLTIAPVGTVYSGLRHDIFNAEALDAGLLAQRCGEIRADPEQASLRMRVVQERADERMAMATASAALVADAKQLRRALGGQNADLRLFNIALPMPGKAERARRQADAFERLHRPDPVALHVCDGQGTRHRVSARVRVRQFMLPADRQGRTMEERRRPGQAYVQLLGGRPWPALGGHLKGSVDAMNAQVTRLHDQLIELQRDYTGVTQGPKVGGLRSVWMRERHDELQGVAERLERRLRTLEAAGRQLKSLCSEGIWPVDADTRCKAAARLALIGQLMGETPVLSCMSGNDLIRQVRFELQFLVAFAHTRDGCLPPLRPGATAGAIRRSVSGSKLRCRISDGPPGCESTKLLIEGLYKRVSGLAHTLLITPRGNELYSGLHHDIFNTEEFLRPEFLGGLSDAKLRLLIGDEVAELGVIKATDKDCALLIETKLRGLRTFPAKARRFAMRASVLACNQMASETATAAVVADDVNYTAVLSGKRVAVKLFVVCLPDRHEHDNAFRQRLGYCRLVRSRPAFRNPPHRVKLHLNGPEGRHSVVADVKIREFSLLVDGGPSTLKFARILHLRQLLGHEQSPGLGGEVIARVALLWSQHDLRSSLLDSLERQHSRFARAAGVDDPESLRNRAKMAALKGSRNQYQKTARTLKEAGQQLKDIWRRQVDGRMGADPRKEAAARLALIGYLLQETPVLSCTNSRYLHEQLEPEIESLVTYAHNHDGHLPPLDQDLAGIGQLRA